MPLFSVESRSSRLRYRYSRRMLLSLCFPLSELKKEGASRKSSRGAVVFVFEI